MLFIGDNLNESERLIFYDGLLHHFLEGENLPQNNISDSLKVAFACVTPQIRVLQSKFNNGAQKKYTEKAKASLCLNERSELKRTEANQSESYNINNPFPKLIYILNKYNNSNQSSARMCAHARETNKTTSDDEILRCLTQIEKEDQSIFQFFQKLINEVETKIIKIGGIETPPEKIIKSIRRCVMNPNFINMLATARDESNQPEVRDQLKYAVSVLYNLCNKVFEVPPADFSQRSYTKEELNSLFDNLDDIPLN